MKKIEALEYCRKCPKFYLYFRMKGRYWSSYNLCWYENVVIGAKCSPPDELDFCGSRKEIHVQIQDSLLVTIENEKAHDFFRRVIDNKIVGASIMFNQSILPSQLLPYADRYMKLNRNCMLGLDNNRCLYCAERRIKEWNSDKQTENQ